MIRQTTALVFLAALGARADDSKSSATLPLEELLQLHQRVEQAKKPVGKPPPLPGSVAKLELSGRIFDEGIELTAHFEVSVLSDGGWITLPLLRLDPRISITVLPDIEDSTLVRQGDNLVLVSKKAGAYQFDLSLILEAQKEKRHRRAQLSYPGATLATMRVQLDESLFRVIAPKGRREAEGYILYPKENQFSVEWEQLVSIEAPAAVKRPPVQPLIERARASIVSTLEGKAIHRVLYDFRCERSQPIDIAFPEGHQLERVFLNGASIPFAVKGRTVQLVLEPAHPGHQSGKLELVLGEPLGHYHLSGELRFSMPRAGWPVNEMYLQLHLPSVFQYKRAGGSMEETPSQPPVEFSEKIPTPGKELTFHQFLITSSAPEVQLAYDVELSGSYFH